MRKVLGLVALLAVAATIAACGSDDKSSSTSSGGGGSTSTTSSGPDVNQKGEGKLNMVIWEGYADKSFANAFTKQTGCKVNAVPAGTSDEMFTKFRSGGGGQYDLVSPSGDASLRLIKSGAAAPLDTAKLTNFNDLAPQLQSPDFNTVEGKHYGLSFMWGANVLIYNKDKIKTPPTSWADLYSQKYKGKITVPDNPIQIADVALQFEGAQDPYAIDEATLDKVKAKLKQQRPLVRKYWVLASDFESLFKSGDAVIGAGWPLMTNDLRKAGMNVGEVLPKEGVTGWSDSWMISSKAQHPICAYKWMNYVTSPKVQKQVADVTAYSPANLKTCEVVGQKQCKALHIRDEKYYDTIKYWQTPIDPTNYRQWSDAWAEVRG
jgi:putative spermidine/putrescine transport system substrate-binding protein